MTQETDPRWWSRVKIAWPYASWVGSILFILAGAAGIFAASRMGIRNPISFLFAISDPAAAALLLMSLAVIVPDIYIPTRLRLTHVFALPTLYMLGVLTFRFVIAASSIGLVMATVELQKLDRMWSNLTFLAALWVGQVLLLLLIFAASNRRKADKLP